MNILAASLIPLLVIVCKHEIVGEDEYPILLPKDSEIVVTAGRVLSLNCIGNNPLVWYTPNYNLKDRKINITSWMVENNLHKSNLIVKNVSVPYVGYYGCGMNGTKYEEKFVFLDHLKPKSILKNTKLIYAFVEDQKRLLVPQDTTVNAVENEYYTIPCKPTVRSVEVSLEKVHPKREKVMDKNHFNLPGMSKLKDAIKAEYEPRIGYTMRAENSTKMKFKCTAKFNGKKDESDFNVIVWAKPRIKNNILPSDLNFLKLSTKLYMACEVDDNFSFQRQWYFSPCWDQNCKNETLKDLNVNSTNLSYYAEESGFITCSVSNFAGIANKSARIIITDIEKGFMEIEDDEKDYFINETKTFKCKVSTFLKPDIYWIKLPENIVIRDSENGYKVETENNSLSYESTLKIEYLAMNHSGVYVCKFYSTNSYISSIFNEFKADLSVSAKPRIINDLLPSDPYFVKNSTTLNISCDIDDNFGFQRKWYFFPCIDENCKNVTKTQIEVNSTTLAFKVKQNGFIVCSVSDLKRTANKSALIIITDIEKGYIEVNEDIKDYFINETKTLKCKVSTFLMPDIYWIKQPDNLVIINGENGYEIETKKYSLSRESTLKIKHLTTNHSGTYICKFNTTKKIISPSFNNTESYLNVLVPYIDDIHSNSNSSDFEFVPGEQNVEFSCNSEGLPIPTINWYKNNEPINQTDDRIFISESGTKLNFKFIKMDDHGYYNCMASNRMGSKKKVFSITIQEKRRSFTISIVSTAVVLALVMVIGVLLNKLRKDQRKRDELMKAGFVHFENGAVYSINPDLGIDEQAELLPYEPNWEFPRDKLKLGKQLGSGAFGVVVKAVAQGIVDGEESSVVAVKMVNKSADYTLIKALVSELKIMVHIGKHPNIVNLLGACTDNPLKNELLVIVEYCEFGNLNNFLIRNRKNFVNQINPKTGAIDYEIQKNRNTQSELNNEARSSNQESVIISNSEQPQWRSNFGGDYNYKKFKICLSTSDLLSWSYQIAAGMEYLSKRKILHGDLAARNVLLASNNIVKICDFGLAKRMYNTYNYKKKTNNPLPVKWMSIEAIRDRIFSTQSDVWAYGILLWEIFSLGCSPYPGIDANEAFFKKLLNGHRMERPQYANQKIYAIMLECWRSGPVQRPSFNELVIKFGSMLDQSTKSVLKMEYEKFEKLNKEWLEKRGNMDYLAAMNSPEYTNLTSINPKHHYVNGPIGGSSTTHPLSPDDDERSRYLQMKSVIVDDDPHYKYPIPQKKLSIDERISMKIFDGTRIKSEFLEELKDRMDSQETRFDDDATGSHTNGLASVYEDVSKFSTEPKNVGVDCDNYDSSNISGRVEGINGYEPDLNEYMNPIYDYINIEEQ